MVNVNASVQSQDPTTNEAWVRGFCEALGNCQEIIRYGQFSWATMYSDELELVTETALKDDKELKRLLWETTVDTPVGQFKSYIDGLLELDRDRAAFTTLLNEVRTAVRKHLPADPDWTAKSKMGSLLEGYGDKNTACIGANAVGVHSGAFKEMAKGMLVAGPGKPPFRREPTDAFKSLFRSSDPRKQLTFPGLLRMWELGDSACGDFVIHVGRYLRSVGAPKCHPSGKAPAFTQRICSSSKSKNIPCINVDPKVNPTANLFTLLPYKRETEASVDQFRTALSLGYTLHAEVISGTHIRPHFQDNPSPWITEADHHLLIIGYEELQNTREYVFWDPDAVVSPYYGGGFGKLYFARESQCKCGQHEVSKYGINVHANGRFTTAQPDDDLGRGTYLEVGGKNHTNEGLHLLQFNRSTNPNGKTHHEYPKRYQVISTYVVTT
jgi:hypothetical protein